MSASSRRSVSTIAGWRASHGPNRHHRFHETTRMRVSTTGGGSHPAVTDSNVTGGRLPTPVPNLRRCRSM